MKAEKNPRRTRRLALCHACMYSESMPVAGITCGPPLVGAHVDHDGKRVHLCGCVMTLKTAIPSATCPIGKW